MLQRVSLRYLSLATKARCFSGDHAERVRTDILTKEDIQKYEKFIVVEPDYTEGLLAPGNVIPKIRPLYSSTFVKFLARSFSSAESEAVSDTFYPPSLTENSVFIYQSNQLGTEQRLLRSGDYILGAFLLAGSSYPVFSAAIFGGFYFWLFNSLAYTLQRRLVLRADLLPHINAVNFQKVGAFGSIKNQTVQVEDLEHVDYEEFKDKENYFWGLNYKYVDHRLIFRNKQTQELFLFDRTGLWSKEGLNNKLIN